MNALESLRQMPKIELHAHLNGCIRDETLFALARERNVTLNPRLFSDHRRGRQPCGSSENNMYNLKPRSLKDCFDMFAEIPKAVDDLVALRRITTEALKDFAAQNVVYLELRSTPKRLLHRHCSGDPKTSSKMATKEEYIQTILQVMDEFEKESTTNMICRFIIAVDRSQSISDAIEHVDLAIKMKREGISRVVGVDLGGNPTKNDFRDFAKELSRAKVAHLGVTVHCGEVPYGGGGCDDDTRKAELEAVLDFRPDRLGHALLLPKDLQQKLSESRIPIESCPTSNVMTLELAHLVQGSLVDGLRKHPSLKKWLDTKHPLVIGTDDPGVFGTNATKELWLVNKAFDWSADQLLALGIQAMEYAFCSKAVKERVVTLMKK